jgi:hypothetical protein
MVNLYVGPSRVYYRVHKDILCMKVLYFESIFGGDFKEAGGRTASFPEDEEVAFDLILRWIYTKALPPRHKNGAKSFLWPVVDFYVLADKLCLPDLQDRILDACRASLVAENALPTVDDVVYAYSHTSPKSPLRKFALMAATYALEQEHANEVSVAELSYKEKTFHNHEYLWQDIESLQMDSKEAEDPLNPPACVFHRHGKNGEFYTVKDGNKENTTLATPTVNGAQNMSKNHYSKLKIHSRACLKTELRRSSRQPSISK